MNPNTLVTISVIIMVIGFFCLFMAGIKERRALRALAHQLDVQRSAQLKLEHILQVRNDIETMRDQFKADMDVMHEILTIPQILGFDFHHDNGVLVCGTVRIAREDFDSGPSEEFRKTFWDWICRTMNTVAKLQNQVLAKAERTPS